VQFSGGNQSFFTEVEIMFKWLNDFFKNLLALFTKIESEEHIPGVDIRGCMLKHLKTFP
jgi:hypothetical protein